MEMDGKGYYEKLAAETSFTGLKNIFLSLAQDEQKHYDIINNLKSDVDGAMAETTVLDEAKNVFQQLMAQRSVVVSLKRDLDGYEHAMKIEAESVKLYEGMAKQVKRPETARLLQIIADEEKKHFNIMENLYDFVLAPQNFLAWAEFSNLKEF
jgi:rubrerythrin